MELIKREINVIYTIAYYFSILNTNPVYIDLDMVCKNSHFEEYARTEYSYHEYDDLRMILGVVVAYITAYLIHFNIEISSAIKTNDTSTYFD